jgi:hypothetical protein
MSDVFAEEWLHLIEPPMAVIRAVANVVESIGREGKRKDEEDRLADKNVERSDRLVG